MSMLYPTNRRRKDIFSEFDTMFDGFFKGKDYTSPLKSKLTSSSTVPRANITSTDEGYRLDLAAPGFSKSEFDIDIEDNILTISIASEDTHKYQESLLRKEYSYTSFSRSWTLPELTDVSHIGARYEAGILSLHIPVERETKVSTKINVE